MAKKIKVKKYCKLRKGMKVDGRLAPDKQEYRGNFAP